ncbi:MAG TPA: hypothetical protein VFE90_07840, partial [Myxococcales bacterium]|nr:hypothetical protein [Myxococcales bacterium]
EARAAALWKKGCENGDTRSCAIARAIAPRPAAPKPVVPVSATDPHDNTAGFALVGLAAVAAGGAVIMAMPEPDHRSAGSSRHGLTEAQARQGSSKSGFVFALSAAAVLSATTGLVVLFSHHPQKDPEKPKVSVGVNPAGLVVSGTMP